MKMNLLILSCLFSLAAAASFDFASIKASHSDLKSLFFQSHSISSDSDGGLNPCDRSKCKLPTCRCSGTDIPGGLKQTETPQMVVLTFQNGIRKEDLPYYNRLFSGVKNPNGCPATGTFFVAHEWTDYYTVQSLYSQGHEIGVNGINSSHTQDWYANASEQDWIDELGGQADIISLMANVPRYNIWGERAPYLQPGGDNQISAMQKSGLIYDASRATTKFATAPNLMWPYTYDYDSTQDCVVGPCPNKTHPGAWEVPLLALTDQSGHFCTPLDACNATTRLEALNLIVSAFIQHYTSNRAPLVLTLSARWVQNPEKLEATISFLTTLQKYFDDTYIISASRMLQWIWKPTKLAQVKSFPPWKCDQRPPYVCSEAESQMCRYDENRRLVPRMEALFQVTAVKYQTTTCLKTCPRCYPWVKDVAGTKC